MHHFRELISFCLFMRNMSFSTKTFIHQQIDGNVGRKKTFEETGFESELTSDTGPHNEIQLWPTDAVFWCQRVVYPIIVDENFSCVPRENHLSLHLGEGYINLVKLCCCYS